ncbi:hypothetical protein TDB9533_04189 [Thalassocella blandensis]|nr:hypothetical protein TDB9533_04189 [Thalassocella blandensis]
MLSHRSESKNQESTVFPQAVEAPVQKPQAKPQAESASPRAVIGPKIRFKGELIGEEDLLVQGTVEGTIDLKGHNLIVGEQGVLHANATAKTITIEGKVQGDLYGEERIAIKSSSQVQGNVKAERVVLEDGAKFRGSIDMDVKSSKSMPPSSASAPSKAAMESKEEGNDKGMHDSAKS